MANDVNPVFETVATIDDSLDFGSIRLSVKPDGRVEVCAHEYSGSLSMTDSIGLAALVAARSNPNYRLCTCGHRYGQHVGTGRCTDPLAYVNGHHPCPCKVWTPKP